VLTWIWGIFNSTYIALLALIPGVNLIMAFVLGAKGNEWAWRNRRWESVERFRRVQRNWAVAGLIVAVVALAGVASIVAVSFGSSGVTTGPTATAPVPSGFVVHTTPEGFSLAIPATWRETVSNSPSPHVKFVATSPTVIGGLRSTVVVVEEDVSPLMSVKRYFDANLRTLQRRGGGTQFEQHDITLPAGRAVELTYLDRTSSGVTYRVTDFFLVHDGGGWVLSFVSSPEGATSESGTFDAVARTFRFLR
jgi:hypothetical protein